MILTVSENIENHNTEMDAEVKVKVLLCKMY